MFRRHRCCQMCAEEYQQEISRPSGTEELLTSLKRNTEAREELTRQMRETEEAIKRITPHAVPTHIVTSSGIRMNLPEQIESDQ